MCKVGGPRCEDKLSHAERAERLAEQAARRRARRAELKVERKRLEKELGARGVPTEGLSMTGLAAVSRAYGVDSTVTVKQGMLSDADRAALHSTEALLAEAAATPTSPAPAAPVTSLTPAVPTTFSAGASDTLGREWSTVGTHMGEGRHTVFIYGDGKAEPSGSGDSSAPVQETGDSYDFASSLSEGHYGWKPVTVPGARQLYPDTPGVYADGEKVEDVQKLIEANGPGQYAWVSLTDTEEYEDDDGYEYEETEDAGWALVYKPLPSPFSGEVKLDDSAARTFAKPNSEGGIAIRPDGLETDFAGHDEDYLHFNKVPPQGFFASAEEYKKNLDEGYQGWRRLPDANTNPTAEELSRLVTRYGPGQYAVVTTSEGESMAIFRADKSPATNGELFENLRKRQAEFPDGKFSDDFQADSLARTSYLVSTYRYRSEGVGTFYSRMHLYHSGSRDITDAVTGKKIEVGEFPKNDRNFAEYHARSAALKTAYNTPRLAADVVLDADRPSKLSAHARIAGVVSAGADPYYIEGELTDKHRPRNVEPLVEGKRLDVDKAFPTPQGHATYAERKVLSQYMGVTPEQAYYIERPGTLRFDGYSTSESSSRYLATAPGVSESVSTATAMGIMENLSTARKNQAFPDEVDMAVHNRVMELHSRRFTDPETPIKLARLAKAVDEAKSGTRNWQEALVDSE